MPDSCSAVATATVTAWLGSPRRLPTAAMVDANLAWAASTVYRPPRDETRQRLDGCVSSSLRSSSPMPVAIAASTTVDAAPTATQRRRRLALIRGDHPLGGRRLGGRQVLESALDVVAPMDEPPVGRFQEPGIHHVVELGDEPGPEPVDVDEGDGFGVQP